MKYGLLVTSPVSNYKNIGDYVQSLAAKQFLKDDYCFIDKETVSEFDSEEPVKVIMNAWYMWHPENWPPKDCIIPLLTSMHITPLTASKMLSNEGKAYLIKHGPVGCRDIGTQKILEEAGIPCYFSACLTLTLGKNYRYEGQRQGVVFANPFIPPLKYIINGKRTKYFPMNLIKGIFYYIGNRRVVNELIKRHTYFKGRYRIQTMYNAGMFYHIYSSRFSDAVLVSADFVSHIVPVNNDDDKALLDRAEKLVLQYSKANLVVTSRIHCALPCLGLETPLVFVLASEMQSKDNMFNAPNRFGGLDEFFRIMNIDKGKLVTNDEELSKIGVIDGNTNFRNKRNWIGFRDKLISQCERFVNKTY